MKKRSGKKLLILLFAILVSIFLLVVTTITSFFADTTKSYTVTQTWKEYHSIEDWNLTKHARVDIDGDGKEDMITFTNCVFLSSVTPQDISSEQRCEEPGMSIIAFPDNSVSIGQKLISKRPFFYQWLRKSYLVKTLNDRWQFYHMNGLQLRKYELISNTYFEEITPSLFDRIDTLIYQFNHLGITLLLLIMWLIVFR